MGEDVKPMNEDRLRESPKLKTCKTCNSRVKIVPLKGPYWACGLERYDDIPAEVKDDHSCCDWSEKDQPGPTSKPEPTLGPRTLTLKPKSFPVTIAQCPPGPLVYDGSLYFKSASGTVYMENGRALPGEFGDLGVSPVFAEWQPGPPLTKEEWNKFRAEVQEEFGEKCEIIKQSREDVSLTLKEFEDEFIDAMAKLHGVNGVPRDILEMKFSTGYSMSKAVFDQHVGNTVLGLSYAKPKQGTCRSCGKKYTLEFGDLHGGCCSQACMMNIRSMSPCDPRKPGL